MSCRWWMLPLCLEMIAGGALMPLARAEEAPSPASKAEIAALIEGLKTEDGNARDRVIEELQRHGPAAVASMSAALRSPNAHVVGAAAESLGLIGDPAAIEALLQVSPKNWQARWQVVWALGRFRDERVAPALIDAARDDIAWVRVKALMGLGHGRDPRAAPALIAGLSDEYYGARRMAAESLALALDERALPALRKALDDADWSVRWAALNALERLDDAESGAVVQRLFNDRVDDVKTKAMSVYRNMAQKDDPTLLVRDLATDDLDWRLYVITRLVRQKESARRAGAVEALAALVKKPRAAALHSPEREAETLTRWRAAWALGELGGDAAISALASLFSDPEYLVRYQAVAALGKVELPAARDALKKAANDASALVANHAKDLAQR